MLSVLLLHALSVPIGNAAEGFGASTPGGSGGDIVQVTNLNDSGAGSLREALSSGNRTVVFDVSGTITLASDVVVRGSWVTLDGFSAPSPGITLRNAGLRIDGTRNDVVIRGIRIRNPAVDGIAIKNGANNILVENVSIDGCGDGSLDITKGAHDVTVAWSVFSSCAKNMLIKYSTDRVTLHHNLFVHSQWRNPWINNEEDGTLAADTTVDMRNNVVWGWGDSGGGTGIECGAKTNLVGNYYSSPGISMSRQENAVIVKSACSGGGSGGLAYTTGNVSADELSFDLNTLGNQSTPFPAASVATSNACTAARAVLDGAGAEPLDDIDVYHLSQISLTACPDEPEEPPLFVDLFDEEKMIEEAGSVGDTLDPDWWVSSGAWLQKIKSEGATLHALLPADDRWRLAYSSSNPLDTDDGYRPQNVFRSVARQSRENVEEQVWFRLAQTNLTDSPNRDAWSGVFLMARYLGENDLYVAGLRHDGGAVIKRKRNGSYTTLGYRKIYPGTYDRWTNPNLIPAGQWIGLRLVASTVDSSVIVRLDVDDPWLGNGWTPLLEAEDVSIDAILEPGLTGLRSDFMDVEFENYAAGPVGSAMPGRPASDPAPEPTPTPEPEPTPTPTPESTSPVCGNGVCEPGEDCSACGADCAGLTNGKPWLRYCCGNGILEQTEDDGAICDGNI